MKTIHDDEDILKAYDECAKRDKWPPSSSVIAKRLGLTFAVVCYHLRKLGRQGIMRKVGGQGQWVRK